jgi:PAS domain S-box-containing protein
VLADAIPTLCWMADADGYIVWYNKRWHDYCGTTPEQMEGWGWQSVHDPELLPEVMARWQSSIATGKPFEMTFPLRGADGRFRPFLTRVEPVRDGQGRVTRWYGANTDVSGQALVEAELARREAYLAAFFEQSAAGMSEVDATGRFVRVNDRYCKITGRTRQELLSLRMQDITHPDDLPGNVPLFERITRTGDSFDIVKRYVRPDGSIVWVHNSVTTVRDAVGELRNTLCVTIDITDRKEAEERVELLAREVDHRANNLMAVVQSTVGLSQAETVAELKALITGRVHALAHAHQLLSVAKWEGADLRSLVEQELRPFTIGDAKRARISGPAIILPPAMAQALAMCLHELATNAAKHGALTSEHGRVEVEWCVRESTTLEVVWAESGGPPVRRPAHRGFGATVIERSLSGSLDGSTELEWRATGLRCLMKVPLPIAA